MTWSASHGTYLSGQEAIDTLDLVAIRMERKWGAGRLRLLVSEELRTRFDRQRVKTGEAIANGELEDVIRETRRMKSAWKALDAYANTQPILPPSVWEVTLDNGTVARIVRETEMAHLVASQEAGIEGRHVAVYTLEEIGRLLSAYPSLYNAKALFPGSLVTKIRQSIPDPVDAIPCPFEGAA